MCLSKLCVFLLITRATCGRPSLGLPFRQSIFLSIYLSIYHVAFGKIMQKSLHIALTSSSELLAVFSFAEKAFNQNSKRLSNQALLRLRRVSNSFFKFSKRCLPMNFLLQRSKYTQINDGDHEWRSSQPVQ